MKYKFKPQTGILVAGMLAATYASACYYQGTSALCFASGDTVDTIYWNGPTAGLGSQPIIASVNWLVNANGPSGYFSWSTPIGTGGRETRTGDGGTVPSYCSGPAHFLDFSGHSTSINSWVSNSADPNRSAQTFKQYYSGGVLTLVSGALDPNSRTCQ